MSQHDCKTSESSEPQEASALKKRRVVGIDLAKQVCHLVGRDEPGTILVRKRLYRAQVMAVIAPLPPPRRFRAPSYAVKLMAPQFGKPDVPANTNAMRDTEAIAAAVTRPTMRCVPTQDVDQQDRPALRCVRERRMGERTALVNAVHGLRPAEGMGLPKGGAQCRQAVVAPRESAQAKLPPLRQEMFGKLGEAWVALAQQLASAQEMRTPLATTPPDCQRLRTIPGLGPCRTPALVAAVSAASACKHGRQGAAWRGLVPRQHARAGRGACWASANVAPAMGAHCASTEHG
jgi:transposase